MNSGAGTIVETCGADVVGWPFEVLLCSAGSTNLLLVNRDGTFGAGETAAWVDRALVNSAWRRSV